MTIKNKLIKNTLISTAEALLTHPVNLLLIGFLISRLGPDVYGIISFVTIFSVLGYASLLDLGLQGGLVVYIAEYLAKGEGEKIGRLASSTLIFFTGLGLLLFAFVSYVSVSDFLYVFKFEKEYEESVRFFLLLAAAQLFVQFPSLMLSAIYGGYQRYDLLKGTSVVYKLLTYALIFLVVYLEYDFIYIAWINLGTALLHLVALLAMLRFLPGLSLGFRLWDAEELKKVFDFSRKLFIFRITGLVFNQTDKILISLFLGIAFLTDYEVIIRFASVIFAFLAFLNSAVIPATAELNSNMETEKIRGLFLAGTRYSMILTFSLATPLVAFAVPLVKFWVGGEYVHLAPYLQIFSMHMLVSTIAGFGTTMLVGMKRVDHVLKVAFTATVVNLTLSLLLIWEFGVYGLLIGTVAGFFIGLIPYLYIFRKEFGIDFLDLYRELGRKVYIPGLLFFIAVNAVSVVFEPAIAGASFFGLLSLVGISSSLYLIWAWFVMFAKSDRELLIDYAGKTAR